MTPERQIYRIKMLECQDISEGYYGDVPGVGMNQEIYCRVSDPNKAFQFTRDTAIRFVMNAKWPCRCEPPITLTL